MALLVPLRPATRDHESGVAQFLAVRPLDHAMKPLNIVVSFCAVALFVGCASTGDRTVGQSSDCEVHHVAMIPKRVTESFGMRVRLSPMDTARPQLFPHADEPYDTGACMRSYDYARVYICSACTEARKRWLAVHPQSP